ncbi:deoxyribose-phosphate aldolase [Halotalea alkalilenta]|uniref:deoxyribose-phosphate aldolase n=1 Tax=Halotalea alkalilenta TaxID=376489 RepID=UPI0004827DA1|nr:deoxyribose-phosphate aldolase [Halotalea alkalilenta]
MSLTSLIDHTLLRADATHGEILALIEEAREHGFASVCVNPCWVATCAERLADVEVKVCTVVGFPLGATTTATKALETREAVAHGADEIDMVINIGALKSGDDLLVEADMRAVVEAAGEALVKVIIETALLDDEQKRRACAIAARAGARFVKTSTGFASGGATVEDVSLMRDAIPPGMEVKASGGIRSREDAQRMVDAGASRLGTSAGVSIARGEHGENNY